jgi:DNA-binding response OmpR family regulator
MQGLIPPTILIIEDDPIASRIYRSRLEKEGYKVEVASDGQAGFYRLHGLRPDAVLLDLMLPKMQGVEILKKIRAQSAFQTLPVLVFTNAFVQAMIQGATEAGATAVYNKSNLSAQQIVDAVQKHLPRVRPEATNSSASAPAPSPSPLPDAPRIPNPVAPGGPGSPTTSGASGQNLVALAEPSLTTRQTPLRHADQLLVDMRQQLQKCAGAADEAAREGPLQELRRLTAALAEQMAPAESSSMTHLITALMVLLRGLSERPDPALASRLRTVSNVLDVLQEWSGSGVCLAPSDNQPFRVLVVDDDALSRRALRQALQGDCFKAQCVETPAAAIALAAQQAFDTVLLDIRLPEMDGFKLCEKIRASGPNQATPAIFVTGFDDFRNRAQSTLVGGHDFVSKPFLFSEMTAKTLACCLRDRLARLKHSSG